MERKRGNTAPSSRQKARKEALAAVAAGSLLALLLLLKGRRPEGLLLFLLGTVAAAALLYLPLQREKEARVRRQEQLNRQYSGMVIRLNLYMTAGLSLRSAWDKMTRDYREERERGGPLREVFEEMELTRREILGGVYEDEAYGRFGRRCGGAEYLRLGSLLETYVQQGNRELFTALEQEARNSLTLELQGARQRGERSGTLLLIPMVLLFALTLLMIIVPAFMQMQASL